MPPLPPPSGRHAEFFAHAPQSCPPVPQAWNCVPTRHVAPMQQPAQLRALHAGVGTSHDPPTTPPPVWHCARASSKTQLRHGSPCLPHACAWLPVRQTSPVQHPVHVRGLQLGALTHTRAVASHVRPWFTHGAHRLPPNPHALGSRPVRHCAMPPTISQHPPQLVEPHPPGVSRTQRLVAVSHRSKPCALQSEHALPNPPQTPSVAPTSQTPSEQHPLGQVIGEHDPVSGFASGATLSDALASTRATASTPESTTGKSSSIPERPHPDPPPTPTTATNASPTMGSAKVQRPSTCARSFITKLQTRPRRSDNVETRSRLERRAATRCCISKEE
jgi:hypothetical protein